MGYTHHWIRPKAIDRAAYRKIQRDMLVALELLPPEYPGSDYAGLPIVIVVNGDGLLDQVVHVSTAALQLTENDTAATLEGKTSDGTSIVGVDTIRVVP